MRSFFVLVFMASPLAVVNAQTPAAIRPGERIRIVSPTYTYEGTVVNLSSDTLVVEPDGWGGAVLVPLNSLTRIDVRSGRTWARGAGLGAILGATLGGVGGALVAVFGEPGMDIGGVVVIALGVGGGLGALVGAMTATVRWKDSGVTGSALQTRPVRRPAVHVRFASIRF